MRKRSVSESTVFSNPVEARSTGRWAPIAVCRSETTSAACTSPEDRSAGGMRRVAGSASPEGRRPSRIPEVTGSSPEDHCPSCQSVSSFVHHDRRSRGHSSVKYSQVWPKIPNDRHKLLSRGPFSSRCLWLWYWTPNDCHELLSRGSFSSWYQSNIDMMECT